ncbi:MAG: PTS fructose transporter subunit IIBC [Anaerococcus sp.]|nr:PTS fructose transporter subunit IIBC [Anaerococcus sp.]
MNGVIAVSHASLASGVYSAVKMIAGEFENVRIVEFKENDPLDGFDEKIKEAYKSLEAYKNVIILADLAGGTPFNRSVMSLGDKENVRVIGGLNFASLYQAINSDGDDIDLSIKEILEIGKESLIAYEAKINDDSNEDTDGI